LALAETHKSVDGANVPGHLFLNFAITSLSKNPGFDRR
jgi:hypothetical protein